MAPGVSKSLARSKRSKYPITAYFVRGSSPLTHRASVCGRLAFDGSKKSNFPSGTDRVCGGGGTV